MQNSNGAREELIKEVQSLRCRVAELERVETRSKEIEQALHNGLAQLFAIFKNAPILMLLVDSQMRVQKANSTTLQFVDRRSTEIVGFKAGGALRCLHSLDDPKGCGFGNFCGNCILRRVLMRTFEANRGYCRIETQMPFIRQQGQEQLDLLVSTVPIRISGKDMVVLCLEDITEQKKARAEISNWVDQLEILNNIVVALGEFLELKQVLDTALERTQALLKADGGVIYLFDETSQTFRPAVHRGISEEVLKEVTGFKMGEGLSARVAQFGRVLVLPDLATDPRSISPASAKEGWHSYAGVPIKSKGKVSAVLVLASRHKDYFKVKQIEMLQDIGSHIGMAIEHARLYEGLQQELIQRKKAEDELKKSESKYRFLYERSPSISLIIGTDWMIEDVNRTSIKVSGYSKDDFIGQPALRFVIPEHREKAKAHLVKDFKGENTPEAEFGIYAKDRTVHTILFSPGSVRLYERGQLAGILITGVDITERKRAEQALREAEVRYRTVADFTYDWEDWENPDGTFRYVSTSCERITGYAAKRFMDDPGLLCQLILLEDREMWAGHQRDVREMPGLHEVQFRIRRPDGEIRWIERACQPVTDQQGAFLGYRGSNRDITERKRAEERLLDYQAQLKSLASQLTLAEERERRRIAAEIHDQVSQSLAISKIKLDSLRASASSAEDAKVLDEIRNSLEQTIDNIRSLTFDLSFPVLYESGFEAAVSEWLTDQIQEKHGIAAEFEDDGQPKPLDDDVRVLLFRDVRELLVNVVKHARAHKVKVSIQKVGGQIYVSVEDDGVGFDPAKVVSMAAQRAEFGLFNIRERLEELGGCLDIKSSPGHGCKVTMTAPLKHSNIAKEK